MLNTQIEYNTSRDYELLYDCLKEGKILIGFVAIEINKVPNMELSKIAEFRYTNGIFDIGNLIAHESLCTKEAFIDLCKEMNLQYIPLPK